MGRIRVLPPGLINRIAAGECVERPASVVKELVENALDAGASRIDIAILEGGRGLIQVSDDGGGMDADDLRLAVAAHATSKIFADDDLFNIHTLGFRGEALPSIGAVSRLKITSRPRDSDVSQTINVEAGQITDPTPCAGPPGTTVAVRDLFYCVPARRKFLRTNQTEVGHVTEQLARLALAHPGVAFSLSHQNRPVHRLAATDSRRQRIADFFGAELAEVLLPIHRDGDSVRVEGLVAPPAESRGSGKWEYVFVNGRFVRDRFISHAIKEAYRSLIDPNRYPVAFLFLTIDPTLVDVNVHPTKIEVRWRDSNYIHGQVLAAFRDKFLSTNLDQPLRTGDDEAYRERVRAAMVDFFTTATPRPVAGGGGQRFFLRETHAGTEPRSHEGARAGILPAGAGEVAEPRNHEGGRAGLLPAGAGEATEPRNHEEGRAGILPAAAHARTGAYVGGPVLLSIQNPKSKIKNEDVAAASAQLHAGGAVSEATVWETSAAPRAVQIHNSYLVAETSEGLMIIDQHALHERILYEELRRRIAERPLESQRLLIPEVVRVPADRIEALETRADTLARLGIELTPSGPQTVTLHAFPSLLFERVEVPRFVRDLLDLLSEHGNRSDTEALIHHILDMMACKAAVKAGDPLTSDEVAALLARRELAERSSNCPHGRPTTLRLSLRDLERQFRRR